MKYLPDTKIDIVNEIAFMICNKLCPQDTCSGCQLGYLRDGIRFRFEDKLDIKDITRLLKEHQRSAVSDANKKYDDFTRYELNVQSKGASTNDD